MSALVFIDTETTGLSLDDDVWEFAAIRRESDGTETRMHLFIRHGKDKCARLPEAFRNDHLDRWPTEDDGTLEPAEAAVEIASLFRGRPHVVGAVPNFDTERLALLLRRHGYEPGWHYHLIDVENLAVGYLAAGGVRVALPWSSDDLSHACGVEPPTIARHTAMGDAEWARDLYDAITGGCQPDRDECTDQTPCPTCPRDES